MDTNDQWGAEDCLALLVDLVKPHGYVRTGRGSSADSVRTLLSGPRVSVCVRVRVSEGKPRAVGGGGGVHVREKRIYKQHAKNREEFHGQGGDDKKKKKQEPVLP